MGTMYFHTKSKDDRKISLAKKSQLGQKETVPNLRVVKIGPFLID